MVITFESTHAAQCIRCREIGNNKLIAYNSSNDDNTNKALRLNFSQIPMKTCTVCPQTAEIGQP